MPRSAPAGEPALPRSGGDRALRRPHDRRQGRRPGAPDLHPASDLPGRGPDAAARGAHSGARPAAGAGLREALDELPGHRHGPPLRLDHRADPRRQHLLARDHRPRLRPADPPVQFGHPLRGHVHGDQGGGRALRGGRGQVRPGRVRGSPGRPARPGDVRAPRGGHLRKPGPGHAPHSGGALEDRRPARLVVPGPHGLRRHHRDDDADGTAAADPAVLGRPDLRADAGPRDGLRDPVGADGGNRRGPRGHPPGWHPLPDHAVHGVRGEASPEVHGGQPPLGRGARQDRVHRPGPHRGGLQAELHRPGARLPDRRVLRRHPRRPLHRGVLHEPVEGREGHVELLRPLPARRGARLQRSGEGGRGHRLPASSTRTTSSPRSRPTSSRRTRARWHGSRFPIP